MSQHSVPEFSKNAYPRFAFSERGGVGGMAMKCPNCGAERLNDSHKFCPFCGGTLDPVKEEQGPFSDGQVESPRPAETRLLRKKHMTVAVVSIIAIIILAGTLAFLFQPIAGRGSVSSTEVLLGTSVQFAFDPTSGVGPYEYLWRFGDGVSSSEKNPTHKYEAIGRYSVTVSITNWLGVECSWSTTITVRLPLAFIDSVSVPSLLTIYPGSTYFKLFVNGIQRSTPAGLQPGTTYDIRLQVIGVMDFSGMGGPTYETILVDEQGTVTPPTASIDRHYVLELGLLGGFTLAAA